eukprot:1137764-Pelagomonas_calceolata.AAC.5
MAASLSQPDNSQLHVHWRSKHIDIVHHFARERVARKEVKFEYCPTAKTIADIKTKALAESKFEKCCKGMGVG